MVRQSIATQRVAAPSFFSQYRKWIIGVVAFCIAGGGIAWGVRYQLLRAQTARVDELRQQLASAEKLPEAERRELWEQMREEMRKLPEAERDRYREEGRQQFQQQMEQRIREVLSLPPAERTAVLDKQINEQERRRKESEARRAAERARRASEGANREGGGNNRGGERGGGPQQQASQSAPSENRGGNSYQDPNARRRQRLSQTSPTQRAELAEYRRLMNERRKQRGLPERRGRG